MKRVFVRTYGCQTNERDSEALRALLQSRGYALTEDASGADVILLNTCSVREQAEAKALGKLGLLRAQKRRRGTVLGILGCMAQRLGSELLRQRPEIDFILGTEKLSQVADYLDRYFGNPGDKPSTPLVDVGREESLSGQNFPHELKPRQASAFVSIMQGCNLRCRYCIVPQTRGRERHRPMEAILDEIRQLLSHGIQEVTLLGQIVNRYGYGVLPVIDGQSPFVQLLEKLQSLDGLQRIRFLSSHPKDFGHDLIACFGRLSKLCPHVHLPLQSASDRILKAMGRLYTREQFQQLVSRLQEKVPDLALSTDLIVGFPGESEEDFGETLDFFEKISFDMAFIFRYSPRSGTAAALSPEQIPEETKAKRQQILLRALEKHSLRHKRQLVGTTQSVLVEGRAHRGEGRFWGRNPGFHKIIFDGHEELIGQFISVRIESASPAVLLGKIVG
jgi:tRNA-2-methylthio-N6-dimethylallyladenosine synthase